MIQFNDKAYFYFKSWHIPEYEGIPKLKDAWLTLPANIFVGGGSHASVFHRITLNINRTSVPCLAWRVYQESYQQGEEVYRQYSRYNSYDYKGCIKVLLVLQELSYSSHLPLCEPHRDCQPHSVVK